MLPQARGTGNADGAIR